MESVTSTTTRDILGLAVFAVLFERPSNRSETVDAARGLCLPWLTPTREVVAVLLSEYCDQVARAQAELDVLTGESREDERDAVALPPFST